MAARLHGHHDRRPAEGRRVPGAKSEHTSGIRRLDRQDRPIVLALGALRPSFDARTLDSLAIDHHTLVLDLAAFAELTAGESADAALRR